MYRIAADIGLKIENNPVMLGNLFNNLHRYFYAGLIEDVSFCGKQSGMLSQKQFHLGDLQENSFNIIVGSMGNSAYYLPGDHIPALELAKAIREWLINKAPSNGLLKGCFDLCAVLEKGRLTNAAKLLLLTPLDSFARFLLMGFWEPLVSLQGHGDRVLGACPGMPILFPTPIQRKTI